MDDIVLNLEHSPANASLAHTKVKGGRWTDRLKASKSRKRPAVSQSKQPPAKRLKTAEASTKVAPQLAQSLIHQPTVPSTNAGRQIISSLFTSNPVVPKTDTKKSSTIPALPTNAPLHGSNSFLQLGLDPLLVSHLQLKMQLEVPTAIQAASLPPMISSLNTSEVTDFFIQSQTGSGKTLSFLLPIIQDLLPLSSLSHVTRAIGTLAIIIAPTRELAKQISDVLEDLLQLRLRPYTEVPKDSSEPSSQLTRWLVSGLLTGGATRTHEKARLRKGVPILVSTPGRLLDHLQHTTAFDVSKCRWLVLDEADRLMDLGFEDTIDGILKSLDGRRRLAIQSSEQGNLENPYDWDWSRPRRTVLCSATIREDVQNLAGRALSSPLLIKVPVNNATVPSSSDGPLQSDLSETLSIPAQLIQNYMVVPLKLRLVSLVALLRTLLGRAQNDRLPQKIIVFLSCTDSVDFHWSLLGTTTMKSVTPEEQEEGGYETADRDKEDSSHLDEVEVSSSLIPNAYICKLHGSMTLSNRQASLRRFRSDLSNGKSAILLCTSVASRGLDLPLVRVVIQYDLPTDSGHTEYIHRVGRTARAGHGGEAWSFVSPSEIGWVDWLTTKLRSSSTKPGLSLQAVDPVTILSEGLGGDGAEYQKRATQAQLAFEQCVLKVTSVGQLASKAFASHIRAYATHPIEEKSMFHVRNLHLGHVAKSFALREAPAAVTGQKKKRSKIFRRLKEVKNAACESVQRRIRTLL